MPSSLDLRARPSPTPAAPAPTVARQATTGPEKANGPRGFPGAPHPSLAWDAPEYVVRKKTLWWYVGLGVAIALLLFAAFLTKSFLSGVVFALLGLLIFLFSERPARLVRFRLAVQSLRINDREYPLRELEAFNIVQSEQGPLLLIRGRRLVLPLIHVPLAPGVDPEAVAALLRDSVREDPNLQEPLTDVFAHRAGF